MPRIMCFGASYCPGCNWMKREQLPKVREAGIEVEEINCMRDVALAKKYKITKLPYIMIFNDSDEVLWEHAGTVDAELLINLCNQSKP